jgi:hypothetical protein
MIIFRKSIRIMCVLGILLSACARPSSGGPLPAPTPLGGAKLPVTSAAPAFKPGTVQPPASAAPSQESFVTTAVPEQATGPLTPVADLVFLNGGALVRVDAHTGRATRLVCAPDTSGASNAVDPGCISGEPAIAAEARKAAVPRWLKPGFAELALLDLDSGKMTTILQVLPSGPDGDTGLDNLAISPDGKRAAFTVRGTILSGNEVNTLITPTALPQNDRGESMLDILSVSTNPPGPPMRIGRCPADADCGLVFSPDGRSYAWADREGVWLGQFQTNGQADKALQIQAQMNDASGVRSWAEAWTTSGTGLLILTETNGANRSGKVYLPAAKKLEPLTEAESDPQGEQRFVMTPGGDLFSISFNPSRPGAVAVFWSILPDGLKPGKPISLPMPAGSAPLGPFALQDGRVAFAIPGSNGGLFGVKPGGEPIERIQNLPQVRSIPFQGDLILSPEGAGIWNDPAAPALLYLPPGGGPSSDLASLAGPGACCFTWLAARR